MREYEGSDEDLTRVVRYVNSYEDDTQDARRLAERCRDYYDGKQWTANEIAILERRNQPVVTINRIASKVDFVIGMESRSRTDPKAHPREPRDEASAETATACIRYVCDENDFDNEWLAAMEEGIIEGTACIDVRMESVGDDTEGQIVVRRIPWDRTVIDPHSRYLDGRDAKFVGECIWMDVDDAIEQWPHAEKVINDSVERSMSDDETLEDRPRWVVHTADGRNRVKVVHLQYRKGKTWWFCTFAEAGFIEPPMESPYTDHRGHSRRSILVMSAKMDRENNRYGAIKHLLDIQDEINHRRSKALHLLSMRPSLREKGAVDDPGEFRRRMAAGEDVEVNPGKRLEMLSVDDMSMGNFQLLAEAKQEIDALGANAALTGKDERSQSGRAIQARQQGGIVELEAIFSRMRKLKLEVYRSIWYCAKQFWAAQRWIRVSGDDNRDVHIALNREITAAEMLMRQGRLSPEQLDEVIASSPEVAMQLGQVVAVENNLGEMNADITIDEAPDFVTLSQEQFEQLSNMAASGVPIPPQVLIKASSLRNKHELIEMLENGGTTPEQQAAAAQQQQALQMQQMQAVQLDLATKAAELEKTHAETQRILAQVQGERAKAAETATNIGAQMRQIASGAYDQE